MKPQLHYQVGDEVVTFDPDASAEPWPSRVQRMVTTMSWADRLILNEICWDIIHAIHPDEEED